MSTTPRVGVVGVGSIAHLKYLPILRRRTDLFTLGGLCDASPTALAGIDRVTGDVPRHVSLEDMLDAGSLDAVVLLTSGSHGALAAQVLGHGLPVLCEKPLALTRREIDELPPDPALQLGYMKLFDPAVVTAGEALRDAGEVRSIEVTVLHPSLERQLDYLPSWRPPPIEPPEATGVRGAPPARGPGRAALLEQALGPAAEPLGAAYADIICGSLVHDLYVVDALVGSPDSIDHAVTWSDASGPGSLEVSATLRGGRTRLSLRWHYLPDAPEYREIVAVHAEAGSVELTFPTPYRLHAPTTLRTTSGWRAGVQVQDHRVAEDPFEAELAAFHDVVVNGAEPRAGIADGRRDVLTCQRIARALARTHGHEIGGEAATA